SRVRRTGSTAAPRHTIDAPPPTRPASCWRGVSVVAGKSQRQETAPQPDCPQEPAGDDIAGPVSPEPQPRHSNRECDRQEKEDCQEAIQEAARRLPPESGEEAPGREGQKRVPAWKAV